MSEQSDYFLHASVVVDGPVEIGAGTKIWHFSKLMGPLTIGRDCSMGQNVVVERNVRVGNNVKIQNNVSVYSGVILEDDVFCGPSMVFTNVTIPKRLPPEGGNTERLGLSKALQLEPMRRSYAGSHWVDMLSSVRARS